MTNHPSAGGSHLPDITIVTPIFDEQGEEIIFFVASRVRPGSSWLSLLVD